MRHMRSVALLLISASLVAESRTWTARSGVKLEADYVSHNTGTVRLKDGKGVIRKVWINQLSTEDQKYIQSLSRKEAQSGRSVKPSKSEAKVGTPDVVARMTPGKTFSRKADGETGITYQVYVPTSFKTNAPPPMIISFSPGGSGKQMISNMKASAEKSGWVLIGCDMLKNGLKDEVHTQKMEDEVLDDIYSHLPNDPRRIYLAGFSGGSSRAYGISARREERIAGIIAYGGWLGGNDCLKKPYCKYMAVAIVNGDKDVAANSWVSKDTDALKKRRCHVKAYSFSGGHSIAPQNITDECIEWMKEDWLSSGSQR